MTVKVHHTNKIKRAGKATPKSERLNWKHVSEIKRFTLRDVKINGETVYVKRDSNSNFLIP